MGMYTTIIHDGRELQIKTGHDSCDAYRVGDTVRWSYDENVPLHGTLLDGVYQACSHERGEDEGFVLIRNHVVEAILPRYVEVAGAKVEMYETIYEDAFGVQPPPASEWSWEARARSAYEDAQMKLGFALKSFLRAAENLTLKEPPERESFSEVSAAIGGFIWERLSEPSMVTKMRWTPEEYESHRARQEIRDLQGVLGPMEKAMHVLERALSRARSRVQ